MSMNKLIQELADQILPNEMEFHKGDPKDWGYFFSGEELEKFAELIIRECLDACSRANEIRHFVPPTQEQVVLSCMREIKEHFGVE